MTELNEKNLEKVSGGMSNEEFQSLEIGARVLVISGDFENRYGTVTGFVDDVAYSGVHLAARLTFDDGTVANLTAIEIIRA